MITAIENYINSSCERNVYDCYTDGSCNNLSANKEGGAAYLILLNGKEILRRSKALIHTTNNRAEMLAIISAVKRCPIGADIVIHTDSKYAIFSFGHRKRISDSVKNSDLIHLYRKEAAQKKVTFEWVKGHNGHPENERCDALARSEVAKIKDEKNQ